MHAAYRQLLETFGRGWEGGDVDTIVSVFAPDAVFLETPFSEQSVGGDAIRAYWKDIPTNQAWTRAARCFARRRTVRLPR